MQAPLWLSPIAKTYWHKHAKHLHLTATSKETFAVLCQTYSDYRQAQIDNDTRQRKIMLGEYVRLAKEFGLTLKSKPKQNEMELDDIL